MATFNASQPYNQINDASGHIYYQQSGSYFSSNQTGAQSLASLPVNPVYVSVNSNPAQWPTAPGVTGSGQLWNDGGVAAIS